jgi:hypothetical protein
MDMKIGYVHENTPLKGLREAILTNASKRICCGERTRQDHVQHSLTCW